MTDLTIVGIALIGISFVGGCFILANSIRANAICDREKIEARFAKQVADAKKEADTWRMLYEEARIKNSRLQSRIEIQNMVYGKVKVKELTK